MDNVFTPYHRTDAFLFIIDEDPGIREMLVATLKIAGFYRAYTFARASDALHLARSVLPDVFIIDYEFPGMTGLQLYEQLQAKNEYIPCILLSAPRSLVEWNNHPLWKLQEPFDIDELIACVKDALQSTSHILPMLYRTQIQPGQNYE